MQPEVNGSDPNNTDLEHIFIAEKSFSKKLDQNWIILKPEVIFQSGSALKTSVFGLICMKSKPDVPDSNQMYYEN